MVESRTLKRPTLTPESYKLVWVASLPRTGSMWTFNVVRAVLSAHGLNPVPEHTPKLEEDNRRQADKIVQAAVAQERGVIKTHEAIPDDLLSHSCFVVTHRDPRDSLMSYMRFQDCTFEAALEVFSTFHGIEEYFLRLPADRTAHVRYDMMVNSPAKVVGSLADFLGLPVAAETAQAIADQFSKSKIRGIISDAEQQATTEENTVNLSGGSRRARDVRTGFQTSHVSDYRDGDWRHILSPAQQAELNARLTPFLKLLGYAY